MREKTFKTLDEQVSILKGKGLVINDEEKTKSILLRENYFFLMGYRILLMRSFSDKRFVPGATFDELYSIFLFDRQLRNILFKNILVVENNLKSILSHVVSKNHGYKEKNYLNVNNFVRDNRRTRQINDLLRKMKRQISINGRQHAATAHFLDNYGYVPLWVAVKVLSFGIVSELYTVLQGEDKKEIADAFNIDIYSFEDYLPILANYRNLCAHEDICYLNKTQVMISDTLYHEKLKIPKINGEYIYGKNDVFGLIIMLKRILNKDDFKLMYYEICYELDKLNGKIHSIDFDKVLDQMGFPLNYKELGDMK